MRFNTKSPFFWVGLGLLMLLLTVSTTYFWQQLGGQLQSSLLSQSPLPKESGLYLGETRQIDGKEIITLGTGATLATNNILTSSGTVIVELYTGYTSTTTEGLNSLSGVLTYNPNLFSLNDTLLLPESGIEIDPNITKIMTDTSGKEVGEFRFGFDKTIGRFETPKERIARIAFTPINNESRGDIGLKELRLLLNPPLRIESGIYLNQTTSNQSTLIAQTLPLIPRRQTTPSGLNTEKIVTGTGGHLIVTIAEESVSEDVIISLTRINKKDIVINPSTKPVTDGYDLRIFDPNTGNTVETTKKPMEFTFTYTQPDIPVLADHTLIEYVPMIKKNGIWVPIPNEQITLREQGRITFTSSTTGVYVLAARFNQNKKSTDKEEAFHGMPTPSPFTPAVNPSTPSTTVSSSGSSGGTSSYAGSTGTQTTNNTTLSTTNGGSATPSTSTGRPTSDSPLRGSACTPSTPFTDTTTHWGKQYIEQARLACIISGKRPGIFAPNDFVTRAELTKIALLAFGKTILEQTSSKPFSDVDLKAWYGFIVATAKQENIISGYGDGTFKPNAYVNRAEALKIIFKAAGKNTTGMAAGGRFIDTSPTAWYAEYVGYAKAQGIVTGYIENGIAYFKPTRNISRAEAVKIIMELLKS